MARKKSSFTDIADEATGRWEVETTQSIDTSALPTTQQRVVVPPDKRGTMPRREFLTGIASALQAAKSARGTLEARRAALKLELLPLLGHALRHFGGDGLDAYLERLFAAGSGEAQQPFFRDLIAQLHRLNAAATPDALLRQAQKLGELIEQAVEAKGKSGLSLVVLEREGVELDAVLSVAFASEPELVKRQAQVAKAVENTRGQLGSARASGVFHDLGRLKTELRLLDAELRRRRS